MQRIIRESQIKSSIKAKVFRPNIEKFTKFNEFVTEIQETCCFAKVILDPSIDYDIFLRFCLNKHPNWYVFICKFKIILRDLEHKNKLGNLSIYEDVINFRRKNAACYTLAMWALLHMEEMAQTKRLNKYNLENVEMRICSKSEKTIKFKNYVSCLNTLFSLFRWLFFILCIVVSLPNHVENL